MRQNLRKSSIMPKNKNHPIEKAGFISMGYFGWIRELISIANKVPFEQDMHYKLAKYDSIETHKSKIQKSLQKNKTIQKMIFSLYKWNIVEYIIAATVVAVLSFLNSFFTANVVKTI